MTPITDDDRARIAAAVGQAESTGPGEVLAVLAPEADGYWDWAFAWSAFVAALALAVLASAPQFYLGMVDRVLGRWGETWTPREVFELALLVAVLKFLGMALLQFWRPLRLFLVPGPIKAARVHARAVTAFRLGAEKRTAGRCGVLVYLSLAERRAVILADSAVNGLVPAEAWGDAMHALLGPVKQGRIADGLVDAIGHIGKTLAARMPDAKPAANEIPDRLIEV